MTVKSLARVVVGAVASSRVAVAVARRSRRRCLRAALAPLAPAQSCRRVRGGVALGRRFRGGGSLSVRAVRSARQLELSALRRWRGRFLSRGGRRRASLTAPLLARGAGAPGAGSVVPPRSRRRGARPPLPRRRLALGARGA